MKIPALISLGLTVLSLSTAQAQIDPQACQRATQNGYLVQNLYSQSHVSLVSIKGARQIFEEIKNPIHRLPYLAAENNCELRAHKISHLLHTRMGGIQTLKVLIETKESMQANGSFHSLARLNGQSLVTGLSYPWSYHTAPGICVRTVSGRDELFVLDPSLFNEPVSYQRWKNQVTTGLSSNLYIESSYNMFNIASENEYNIKTTFDPYDLQQTDRRLQENWNEHQRILKEKNSQ